MSLAAALAVLAVLVFGGASQAQEAAADLAISKSIKPTVVTVGEKQVYMILITNKTGSRAKDVRMTDPLPKNVKFIKASTSLHRPGSCGLNAQRTVVCDLGNLDVNQIVIIKIYVKTTEAGRYKDTASVTHSTVELDATNDTDSATHRAVKKDRDGGGGKRHCDVRANAGGGGATACVGACAPADNAPITFICPKRPGLLRPGLPFLPVFGLLLSGGTEEP